MIAAPGKATLRLVGAGLSRAKDRLDGIAPEGTKGWRQTQRTLALLRARFPKAFPAMGCPPPPLRIGIHTEIALALGNATTLRRIRRALAHHAATAAYRKAVRRGEARVGLDGTPD